MDSSQSEGFTFKDKIICCRYNNVYELKSTTNDNNCIIQ